MAHQKGAETKEAKFAEGDNKFFVSPGKIWSACTTSKSQLKANRICVGEWCR